MKKRSNTLDAAVWVVVIICMIGILLFIILKPVPEPVVPTPAVTAEKTNRELQAGKPFRHIGPNRSHPVVRTILLGFEDACKDLEVDCENNAFEGVDFSLMVPQVDIAISQGSSGVIAFVDKAVYESDKKLMAAGIPIMNVHTAVSKEELPGMLGWVAGDAHAYAVACAEAMGEKLNGEGTVIISQLTLNDLENQVNKDFTDTLAAKYPKIKILPTILEGADQPAAIAIAEAALQAHPEITGAFGTTGNSPVTWAKALQAQSKKPGQVVVIGMDTVRQNLDLVESGWVYAVVAQPLYDEEYRAVELLLANLKGQPVSYENKIDAPLVKKGETAKYYSIVDRVDAQGK